MLEFGDAIWMGGTRGSKVGGRAVYDLGGYVPHGFSNLDPVLKRILRAK